MWGPPRLSVGLPLHPPGRGGGELSLSLSHAPGVGSGGERGRPGTHFLEASSQARETLTEQEKTKIGQLQLTRTAVKEINR